MTQPATRPNAHTDDDVRTAEIAIALGGMERSCVLCGARGHACPKHAARATLDAVAPAIAVRAKAEALREAAEVLPCATEGPDRIGTARWKQPARNGYSIAIEEAQIALRHRADEIEAGR